jgi:hypothetical protein
MCYFQYAGPSRPRLIHAETLIEKQRRRAPVQAADLEDVHSREHAAPR